MVATVFSGLCRATVCEITKFQTRVRKCCYRIIKESTSRIEYGVATYNRHRTELSCTVCRIISALESA
ncbi:hypothetical protein Y032_0330g2699 [Ancylostoma ceylanicum]|uniref:Uncharacterized protein n=1 Tax=Ancylostoma ceylanicum TaxID=53326 RepID=A0A016RZN3_9BILA|nr:hypothetical protein Y032_0330g2699 [Ancylostoma ceylanicum]